MAISIPIISEFVGDGIKKAQKEFKQLEGVGAKAQFALKKAAVPATAAIAGLAAVMKDATQAAIEDAAAQNELRRTLETMIGATNDEVAAVERWIAATEDAVNVADDELRPAYAALMRATGDFEETQTSLNLALDIAAATGKPLETVTKALTKAYGGNMTALERLDPALREGIKAGASLDDVMQSLTDVFGGAASDAAGTLAGRLEGTKVSMANLSENIGYALLPVLEKVIPIIEKFASWAERNPEKFTYAAATIGAIAAAVVAVNVAMALNPFALIAAGAAAVGVAVVAAYKKFEGFRNVVQSVIGGIVAYFKTLANAWRTTINLIIRGINLVKPGKDIPYIPDIFGGGPESAARGAGVPMMATGGVVARPTLALIGEQGPEAVVPLSQMGSMGGVTINVHGGDPNAVVDALQRWYRQNGPLPVKVA